MELGRRGSAGKAVGEVARFQNGWVKIYRSAWENDLGDNPILFALWSTLLIMATWRPSKVRWMGKQRELPPGSVVLGLKELSDKWGCSRSVLQKHLHYLCGTGRIALESCSRGTLITICNWDQYQSADVEPCEPSTNGVLTACSPSVNGEALSKEEKKVRKKEEKRREPAEMSPLAEIWNRHRGQLSEVRGCTGKRLTSAKARWEENPSTEYWSEIVTRISRSDFCNGKSDRGWKADFDFLIQPDSQHKVLEGKYDGRASGASGFVDPEILKIREQLEAEETNGAA